MTTAVHPPELQTSFSYADLDAETRIVVQQRTVEIRDRIKRTAADIVEVGERLIDIKGRLGHGRFGAWLKAEFDWDERTARNLMNVADAFKSETVSDLPIATGALYALSSPSAPEPARREAIEKAKSGQPVSQREAKAIVERYKPSPSKPAPTPPVEDEDASQEVDDAANVWNQEADYSESEFDVDLSANESAVEVGEDVADRVAAPPPSKPSETTPFQLKNARPAAPEVDPFERVLDTLSHAVNGITKTDKRTKGWGGIEAVVARMDRLTRINSRKQLVRFAETFQDWILVIDKVEGASS